MPGKSTLILRLDKVIYSADDSEKVILASSRIDGRKCRLIGSLHNPVIGSIVRASGSWVKHEKYKWQFAADFIQILSTTPVMDDSIYVECKGTSIKVLKEETGFASVWGTDLNDGHKIKLAGRLSKVAQDSTIGVLGVPEHPETYGDRIRAIAWEYISQGRKCSLKEAFEFICRQKSLCYANKIVDVDWERITFSEDHLSFSDRLDNTLSVYFPHLCESMNRQRSKDYFSSALPQLNIAFDSQMKGEVINPEVLLQAIAFQHLVDNGSVDIPPFETTPSESNGKKNKRIRVLRDMTPYIDFLTQSQDPSYPVIPILEYNQGRVEAGSLFTLRNEDSLAIVWENNNDERSTFIFKCTTDSYETMRQSVFDYVMAEQPNKRQVLHHIECATIFGEKPICLTHNNLESWKGRIMSALESRQEASSLP